MQHRVAVLTGALLDAAVAKAEGIEIEWKTVSPPIPAGPRYSSDWARGGPIIERERLSVMSSELEGDWIGVEFDDEDRHPYREPVSVRGATPLVAAMRTYVAAKLGEEVELP